MLPYSPTRFKAYAQDLSRAVYELSREKQVLFDTQKMSKRDLDRALDRGDVEAGSTERTTKWHDQILEVDWVQAPAPQETKPMSITGLEPGSIKAKLAEIKRKATERQAQGIAQIELAHSAGLAKVDAATDGVVKKINAEVDDALQEYAEYTNGGPA